MPKEKIKQEDKEERPGYKVMKEGSDSDNEEEERSTDDEEEGNGDEEDNQK